MTASLPSVIGVFVVITVIGFHEYRRNQANKRMQVLSEEARIAMGEDRMADAEVALRALIKYVPTHGKFHSCLGISLAHQNRLQEAETELRLGADLDYRCADGHLDLAIFYAGFCPERVEEAKTALQRAVSESPDLPARMLQDDRFVPFMEHPAFAPYAVLPPPLNPTQRALRH